MGDRLGGSFRLPFASRLPIGKDAALSSLRRYENFSKPSECKDYIRKDRLNVACRLSDHKLFHYLKMYLNASQGQSVVPQALLLNTRGRDELLHGEFKSSSR